MKKIILILSLILCLLGCSNEQKLDGEIIVRIADDTGARIITSGETPVSMDVDHYSILIDEKDAADIEKKSGGTSFKIGVEPGQHNVTVNAYNKTNDLIGFGSNNVNVGNGDTIQCEVNVSEIAGKGSIKIYVDNLSMEEYLHAEVISLVNESPAASHCFTPGTGFENQEHLITGLDNGFYTVRFFMSSSAEPAEKDYLGEMPVRVVAGKESILSCTFDPKHKDLNYYYYTNNPLSFRPNLIFNYDNSFPMYAKNIIDIGYDKERYEIEVNNVYKHQSGNDSFDYLSREILGFSEDGLWISPNPESLSTGTVDLSLAVEVTDKYTGKANRYYYHLCGVEIVDQKVFHSLRIEWEPENADSLLIHLNHIGHNDSNDINVEWKVNDLPVINDYSSGVEFWNDSIRIYDILSKETKVSATITEIINDKQVTEKISLEYVWENFDPCKLLMDHMQMNSCKDGVAEFWFDPKYMPEDDVMLYSLNAAGDKTVPGALINSAKLITDEDGSQYYAFELPLASDCQFGTHIPILAETFVHGMIQSENVYNVYVFNYDSVSVNLIPSKNGYYSSSERPSFEVVGLERYASYDGYRIEYWLGNAEKKVITDYSGPVELILPDYSKDSSYMLKYRIILVSGDREDSTEGTLFFDYFSDGIPVLPMDKVYFLSQNEPYGDTDKNFSYYLMTTDGTNYYYFNEYRGYDIGYSSGIYYGFSKAYRDMMDGYTLTVIRTGDETYDKVSFRYGENGDVLIAAGPSLKLLNKESGSDSYIGNWEFSDLELGITETRKILDLLVNDNDVANNLIPDAERIVTATNNDKTIFDIKAVASADSITISAVMKSGATGLDGHIGLVSEYRPFAEITLPIEMSSKGEPEIVTANGRVGLQVSSDGSVLILKAMRNGVMVPVPLLRSSSAYESPSVTSTHFDKDMVITEQNLIDSVYEVYRNVYPEELAKMDTRISSVIKVSGVEYDWSGVWKITSSSKVLDNSSLVIFGDEALCVKDGISVFGKCSEDVIDFSSADSWKLDISEKSLNYGELVVSGKLTDSSGVNDATIKLTKQSRNSLEVAAACSRAEGNSFNQAVFASDGSINVSTTNKHFLNDRVIGSYSVDVNNGSIIIQIDSSVYDAIIPYSSDPHLTGARLRFSNDRIQLFAGLDGLLLTTE